jgi:hypothetical protein
MVTKMLSYIEYLNLPTKFAVFIVGAFLILQIVGELMECYGKAVPEYIKVRKYFARKKVERETLKQIPETLREVQELLDKVEQHYSADNITMRDGWMSNVNHKLEENDKWMKEFAAKLDKNNKDTLSLLINSMRSEIINFASCVVDDSCSVTREQFNRIFKLHKEYEEIIKENEMTNGEVDVAYRIVIEAYEDHMRKHSFIEDIRWQDN